MEIINGKLIIIVGPSGAGKSTLIKKFKIDFPDVKESVTYTTRSQREGEIHGTHYFFISVDDFEQRKLSGDFVEWAEVHSNFYGTSKEFIKETLDKGGVMLFDIDTQGADAMKSLFGEKTCAIFIAPPSVEDLEERLLGRKTDSNETIRLRVENAKKELLRKNDYDHYIVNDHIDRAYEELKNYVLQFLGR